MNISVVAATPVIRFKRLMKNHSKHNSGFLVIPENFELLSALAVPRRTRHMIVNPDFRGVEPTSNDGIASTKNDVTLFN
jgi:hypothetical protein